MSIYGNIPKVSEEDVDLSRYLKEDFLNFSLNEEVNTISNKIRDYKASGEGLQELSTDMINMIKDQSYDRNTRISLLNSFTEAVTYNYLHENDTDSDILDIEESTLLEYSGNPEKVKNFKEMLKELDDIFTYYRVIIDEDTKVLDTIISSCSKVKKIDDARRCYTDCAKAGKAANQAIKAAADKVDLDSQPFTRFKQQSNSFSGKYSTITLEDKKQFDKKLASFSEKIINDLDPWGSKDDVDGPKIKALLEALEKFEEVMPELGDKFREFAGSWYKVLFNDSSSILNIVKWCRVKLNLGHSNTIRFKIVQKIFKK